MPGKVGNLDIAYSATESSYGFLFEPKELVPYEIAWEWQRQHRETLLEQPCSPCAAWLLQHEPCYTIGRGGSNENLLFDFNKPPLPFYVIDRGGEVTHHLPGQLVVYLVLDLKRYQTDLHWYLRQLEGLIIDLLEEVGLKGQRKIGLTGVWCEDLKIASIGIGCKRWVTQHGIALNVDCDLQGFDAIVPCGLNGQRMGNLQHWIPGISIAEIKPLMKRSLKKRFNLIDN